MFLNSPVVFILILPQIILIGPYAYCDWEILVFLLFSFTNVVSIEPDEILKDAQLEQRAREISSVLRCMVCQNENIDNSNAGIARDLRILIREELVAGKTNSQIINFVHGKYGDYVLFKPPLKFYTLFLWISPFVIS